MKSIQVVAGRTTDLKNVIDIDRGNVFLLRCGKRDSTYVIDIGRRRKLTYLAEEMYLILHVKNQYEIERLEPGETNLVDHIRSKGYECRTTNYCDHVNNYKEKLLIYNTGFGMFTENGYAFQILKWTLSGAFFKFMIIPCEKPLDELDFVSDYDFMGRYRKLIKRFLTEPENYAQNYDELLDKAEINF